jgi:MerR family transcriptional regulator, light-induced transcriptional regulator
MAIAPDPRAPRHPIRVVARRTGLSVPTLRAWERRHGVVQPGRTDTGRRLYSDADIERLRLLREATTHGHGIAHVAPLPVDTLAALVHADRVAADRAATDAAIAPAPADRLDALERVVRALDAADLQRRLLRASLELGPARFLHDVAVPFCHRIGALWEAGTLSVAEEHVASVVLRQVLGVLLDTLRASDDAPSLVTATPQGERHEFGAMMAGIVAALAGWRVTHLGADLPADAIAHGVARAGARTLALSLVHEPNERPGDWSREMAHVRESLGTDVEIVLGGAAADAAERAGAPWLAGVTHLHGLARLHEWLAARRGAVGATVGAA